MKRFQFLSEMGKANCCPLTFFAIILSQAIHPSVVSQIRCKIDPFQNLMRRWMAYGLAMASNKIKPDINLLKIELIPE